VAAFLCAVSAGAQATAGQAGAVNYAEGQVAVNGKAVDAAALESAAAAGQTLSTEKGRAEALLAPGVFLRLGQQTAVKMTSLAAADLQIELAHGDALIEAVHIGAGRVLVLDGAARITLEKPGIYEFHASNPVVAVEAGRARVVVNDHAWDLGAGREFQAGGESGGTEGRLSRKGEDALSEWSKERALADARASIDTAQGLVATDPDTFKGPGWYWNPFYNEWGFLPASYTENGPYGETYFSARFYWEYASAPDVHSHGYFTPVE
jgi:hypothetical protein